MKRLLLSSSMYLLLFASCTNKRDLTGKWQMVKSPGIVLHFITDSTGFIERSDTTSLLKSADFVYQLKGDTLFEGIPPLLYGGRKWVIDKLDRDSLIIHDEQSTVRYCRLN